MTLYDKLKAAGIETYNHESDLYFPNSKQALAILANHPLSESIATRFRNQRPPHIGQTWIEVPFAFIPLWTKRAKQPA